ncbi:hypothetical protein GTA08_BOTSDO00424 [Botryosphaeria dothidea]|uniref:Uncharacterized protein n=1 Tax=Botryosphaeria dothidea TaxID=55169 RepID=A0A8H4NAX5_9PEZI|nr:hypothetical protein GTA08_BOTSDO00424 [Botryosphaeria dothidea]
MSKLSSWPFSLISRAHLHLQKGGDKPLPQQATDAVMHNIQHSFLHRLLLDILYYLATRHVPCNSADLLALLATTRALRFSPIIHTPAPPLSRHASRAFLWRLRRDDFTRACDAENCKRGAQPPQQAQEQPSAATATITSTRDRRAPVRPLLHPCAGCQALHPPASFSAAQLARAPEGRHYTGTDGVLRVCPHWAFTYAQMRDIREREREKVPPMGYTFKLQCEKCGPRDGEVYGLSGAQLAGFPYGPSLRDDGSQCEFFSVRRRIAVEGLVVEEGGHDGGGRLVVSERKDFTHDVALRVLKAVAERDGVFVCNHVRLGELEPFETKFWEPHQDSRFILRHMCRVCYGVNSPTDKRWLAQIQSSEESYSAGQRPDRRDTVSE